MAHRGPKPVALGVHPEGIPTELRAVARWVGWRYRPQGDDWKKPLVCPANNGDASVIDGTTWGTFEDALAAAKKYHLDGLGLVFTADDDYCGIDLDECRDPLTGKLHVWAADLVERLDSYTEVSPSGMGLRVFVRATLPGRGKRVGGIEVYDKGRYFTVTGRHLEGTPETVEQRQQAVEELYAVVCGGLGDEELLDLAVRSGNGPKFAKLWGGDTSDYDHDESRADAALCRMLAFWACHDPEQVERMFGQSALGQRDKWRDRADYRELTVTKAIESQVDGYRPKGLLTRVIKNKQNKQEESDFKTQGSPGGRQDVLPLDEVSEQGIQVAVRLAETQGDLPDWKATFELARDLRELAKDHPDQFKPAVIVFCERTGRKFEEFWYMFLDCWPKVRTAKGQDVFAWAAEQAKAHPYFPVPNLGPMYEMVASIAWHLSKYTGSAPFWLPRERLASLLMTNAMTITRIVKLLVANGVVKCENAEYSYTKKKAKEYVFVGRPLADAA